MIFLEKLRFPITPLRENSLNFFRKLISLPTLFSDVKKILKVWSLIKQFSSWNISWNVNIQKWRTLFHIFKKNCQDETIAHNYLNNESNKMKWTRNIKSQSSLVTGFDWYRTNWNLWCMSSFILLINTPYEPSFSEWNDCEEKSDEIAKRTSNFFLLRIFLFFLSFVWKICFFSPFTVSSSIRCIRRLGLYIMIIKE